MVNTYEMQPTIEQQPTAKMSMGRTEQPKAMNGMTLQPTTAAADQQAEVDGLRLRGGGEACPGRFCWVVPCPIPCNFCIFPLPC